MHIAQRENLSESIGAKKTVYMHVREKNLRFSCDSNQVHGILYSQLPLHCTTELLELLGIGAESSSTSTFSLAIFYIIVLLLLD